MTDPHAKMLCEADKAAAQRYAIDLLPDQSEAFLLCSLMQQKIRPAR